MSDAQPALFGIDDSQRGRCGALETAVRKSLTAAHLDERDEGGAELAAQLARTIDAAAGGKPNPYAVATAARELRETLTRLKLDPVARDGADAGEVQAWLDQLGAS